MSAEELKKRIVVLLEVEDLEGKIVTMRPLPPASTSLDLQSIDRIYLVTTDSRSLEVFDSVRRQARERQNPWDRDAR